MTLPVLPPLELAVHHRADMAVIAAAMLDTINFSFADRCKMHHEYLSLARQTNGLYRQAVVDAQARLTLASSQ